MCERHAGAQPFLFSPTLQPVGGYHSCSPRFISPQLNLTGNTLTDTQSYVLWLIPNPVRLTIEINHVDTFRDLKQDIVNNWHLEGAHILLCSVSPGEDEKGQALLTSRQDTSEQKRSSRAPHQILPIAILMKQGQHWNSCGAVGLWVHSPICSNVLF